MLDTEQEKRLSRLKDMISLGLNDVYNREDFVVLLFGPAKPNGDTGNSDNFHTSVWNKRNELRQALEEVKFFVVYGEDLTDIGRDDLEKRLNPMLKEQLLLAKANLVLVLAASVGSVSELTFLCNYPAICQKLVIAIHENHEAGFVSQGPVRIAEGHGARIIRFSDSDLKACNVKTAMFSKALDVFQAFVSHLISIRLCNIR